jgi:hypothetical protein
MRNPIDKKEFHPVSTCEAGKVPFGYVLFVALFRWNSISPVIKGTFGDNVLTGLQTIQTSFGLFSCQVLP